MPAPARWFPQHVPSTALLALLSACSPGSGSEAPGVVVRDSAGVQIVESAEPAWGAAPAWTVSAEPVLVIGAVEGEREYLLSSVWSARRAPDGRIAVANAGTHEIRVYGADGRHLRSIGREGEGPGDFQFVREVWWMPGDSLLAFDLRQRRATVFRPDGEVGRTLPLTPWTAEITQPWIRGRFDDGTLVVSGELRSGARTVGLMDGGRRVFARATAEGDVLNPLADMPHAQLWGFAGEYGPGYTSVPFTMPVPAFAAAGTSVFLGDGSSPSLEERAPDGSPVRIIRWRAEPRPVTADAIARHREDLLGSARTPEDRRGVEQILEGMPFPDVMPVYQSVVVDAPGNLWVERYRARGEEERRFWVFDPAGRWLGEVSLPAGLDLREVGEDHVLGVRRDENGVEFVVVHALTREAA